MRGAPLFSVDAKRETVLFDLFLDARPIESRFTVSVHVDEDAQLTFLTVWPGMEGATREHVLHVLREDLPRVLTDEVVAAAVEHLREARAVAADEAPPIGPDDPASDAWKAERDDQLAAEAGLL